MKSRQFPTYRIDISRYEIEEIVINHLREVRPEMAGYDIKAQFMILDDGEDVELEITANKHISLGQVASAAELIRAHALAKEPLTADRKETQEVPSGKLPAARQTPRPSSPPPASISSKEAEASSEGTPALAGDRPSSASVRVPCLDESLPLDAVLDAITCGDYAKFQANAPTIAKFLTEIFGDCKGLSFRERFGRDPRP